MYGLASSFLRASQSLSGQRNRLVEKFQCSANRAVWSVIALVKVLLRCG